MTESKESFTFKGVLKGHNGWVTCLASPGSNNEMLVSGSRDKTLIVWELTREQNSYGYAKKSLQGHGHFISDVDLSKDGQYALSGSWDKTLRLWDLSTGQSTKTFVGHEKDVLSVAFSDDNRQIVSGSRDRTIKLWNILGEMKYELRGHTDWVGSVAFSANADKPAIVSGGWDRVVKVWEQKSFKLDTNLIGHTAFINVVTVSPDGSLCASGGKDGTAMLWDLSKGNHLYSLNAGECVNALKFSPSRYWLCAATNNSIKIWDLETKESVAELIPEKDPKSKKRPSCVSLAWSADGTTLFSGYTDGVIRVWGVSGV